MDLNERFDVSPAKVAELRDRIRRLGVDLGAVQESFSRGSGKGGQHRHKTSNRVTLRYAPFSLVVHAAADRRRTVNRFLALRELVDRVEAIVSPATSRRLAEVEEARKRKARRRSRSRVKYALAAAAGLLLARPSSAALPTDAGVLIMAHGGTPDWNAAVSSQAAALARRLPVEIAFGMADPETLQAAADRLRSRGARRIAVVRLFISGDSFLERTRKILGLEPGAPARPADAMPMMHEHGMGGGPEVMQDPDKMPLWRVECGCRFSLSPDGLMDADRAGAILADRTRALSTDPRREAVLILGHGPATDAENRRWLERMDHLADAVRRDRPYRIVHVANLREDWPRQRKAAEKDVRDWVERESRDGRVLVVPFRVHGLGPYAEALRGLRYTADSHGLAPDPRVADWLGQEARKAFDQAGWSDAARILE